MELPILKDVVVIFALSIAVILLFHLIRLPPILGFLITGILSGPHGLGLVKGISEVQILAEIGIIVLMFTVGMEISIRKILQNKKSFFLGGALQVVFTTLAGIAIGNFFGRPFGESIFLGFLLSLSSTAIVLKILQDTGEVNSPHGKLILGILIFQDVMAVPMILLIPILTGDFHQIELANFNTVLFGLGFLFVTFFAAVRLVPKLLYYVAQTRSQELFLLTILMICFSVAWMASSVGLSLALGAFLAGLIISESEYSFQAMGDVIPFRDIFTSFFFVSIGMLLDLQFLIANPIIILLAALAVLILKSFIVIVVSLLLGTSIRTAILSGTALSQVGEFSFVLATLGMAAGLGTQFYHQLFLAIAIVTMGLTPLLIKASYGFASYILKFKLANRVADLRLDQMEQKLKDHIIIIGFGVCGRNLARSASEAGIPYIILELNPETVRLERLRGEPIYFGDACRENVLKHFNIGDASVVAILVNDPIATLRIVDKARKLNKSAYIIARTRFIGEIEPTFVLGADDVIADEYGASVEIFTRVLHHLKAPSEQIEKLVAELRAEGYEMMRNKYMDIFNI